MTNWTDHQSITDFYEKHGGKARKFALFIQDEYEISDTFELGVKKDLTEKTGSGLRRILYHECVCEL